MVVAIAERLIASLHGLWAQCWFVSLVWLWSALVVVVKVKHAEHKCMLTFYANVFVSLTLTYAMAMVERKGPRALRANWQPILLVAVLMGLERNLTNSSMYKIGASLKTALHVFNVPLTFFLSALLGADKLGRRCVFGCACFGRGSRMLTLALALVVLGGLILAVPALSSTTSTAEVALGVSVQISSGVFCALRVVVSKLLLGDAHGDDSSKPSKLQLSLVTFPATGFSALLFLPFFESSFAPPPASSEMGSLSAAHSWRAMRVPALVWHFMP